MRPEVLLVDLVGTLVDEQTDYESLDVAMEQARLRYGVNDEASALSGDFSLALMEILRAEPEDAPGEEAPAAEFIPFESAAKDIFAAVLEVRGISTDADDAKWFWDTFLQAQRENVRLHADALPALDWARKQGFKVTLISDVDPYFVTDILPRTGLLKHVDGVVTAAEVGYPKPSPHIFHAALARAVAMPSAAIMVGDSYERDVLGARGAGIARAILVDRHSARTVDDVPVVRTLSQLPQAVARVAPGLN